MILRPRHLLWAAIGAYATGFAALSILRYHAFNTGRFDLGNMTQAVWATAHGHPLAVTNLEGEQTSRLGSHVDPILVAFAPLWWIWPSPSMLLAVQAIAIALGALPVFWLARKHLGSERAALGFALAYLLYPAVQWLTLAEFHPVALACPLLLYAFWYLDEDRLVPFAAFAGLAALTKEDIPLVIAGLGIWYALSRKRYRIGGAIAAVGIALTAFSVKVVMPHFNAETSSRFYQRYGTLGDSPGEILATIFTHPGRVVSAALDSQGLHYLADLGLPLVLLFAAAPLVLVAALPELGLNLLSAAPTQSSIHHHYTAGLIPPLVAASVLGAARLARGDQRRGALLASIAVGAALVANYAVGALPLWRSLPGGSSYQAHASNVAAHDRITERALGSSPTTPSSAQRTRSDHTSRLAAGSSASRPSATRSGSQPTRLSRATPTAGTPARPQPTSPASGGARTGGSSSPRTACSSSSGGAAGRRARGARRRGRRRAT